MADELTWHQMFQTLTSEEVECRILELAHDTLRKYQLNEAVLNKVGFIGGFGGFLTMKFSCQTPHDRYLLSLHFPKALNF